MFFYLSGLLLLLLDPYLICGQATQNNSSQYEDNGNYTNKGQENLQGQEHLHNYSHCFEEELSFYGERFCWADFNKSMTLLGEENWCDVKKVVGSYHILTDCLEHESKYWRCFYPNRVVEQLFVRIHQHYFHSCSDEDELSDAPPGVVLAATLLPITLIPFIVYIVVWKSSLRD